jgi:hypothetical protein
MRRFIFVTGLLGLSACSTEVESPRTEGVTTAAAPFVVHEWGTFTAVQSSVGAVLEGLHHEDEALPPFVHGRGTLAGSDTSTGKDVEAPVAGVTQKLETPVLYFYGDVTAARVAVDFPSGIVSQWYPRAESFAPALGEPTIAGGTMTWQIDLVPGLGGFVPVAPDDVWAPSRRVASLPVRVGDEAEQFIFYRGLGAFATPFSVRTDETGKLKVANASPEPIAAVFLLHVHAGGGLLRALGSLGAGAEAVHDLDVLGGKEHDLDAFVTQTGDVIAAALESTGLYPDEARAMVDTWSHSYFRQPGLRVLYLVPSTWTDALLPLRVDPTPAELVRTLVGRVEVLTPAEESDVVAKVEAFVAGTLAAEALLSSLGRFAEPKLRRAAQLIADPATLAGCESLITLAASQP